MKYSLNLWAAILLAVLAVLVAVLQCEAGTILVGGGHADDGAFAVSTLIDFNHAMGWPLPRWSPIGNTGLGTPVFYFYPPGAYMVAHLIGALLPKTPAAIIIGLAMIVFRVGNVLTCTLWLRRHVEASAALAGGALYALMPYIAVLNPQVRLDFAETAASALLPLVFLAADLGKGQMLRTIIYIAPAMALITIVHLPTAVLTGGLIVVYTTMLDDAGLDSGGWTNRIRQFGAASLGIALGLGLAGATLIPALLLLKDITPKFLDLHLLQPEQGFLFKPKINYFHSLKIYFLDACLVVPVLAAGIGFPAALRRRGWPRAVLVTLALAVFLTLSISAPIWALPLPLRRVQFPWRLLVSVSMFGAALAAVGLAKLGDRAWRGLAVKHFVFLAGVAAAMVWAGLGIYEGDHGQSGSVRTQQAMASSDAFAEEYFPATGGSSWARFRDQGAQAIEFRTDKVTGCPEHRDLRAKPASGSVLIDVSGCTGLVILPQFYFPGWIASGSKTKARPDPRTGLIVVTVPEGQKEIVLRRVMLWQVKAGAVTSACAAVLWIILAATLWRSRPRNRRLSRQRGDRSPVIPLKRLVGDRSGVADAYHIGFMKIPRRVRRRCPS